MQLSLLPVLEWPAVIGVPDRTGEGDEEMDSVLRDSVRHSGPSRTPEDHREVPLENETRDFANCTWSNQGKL